ncbi:zinc-dependent metalloprotease [Nocardioides sp. J2M5]|uniref:zinc-dependent metalloprotease n=1 Tax=Nocardioides palaemonis TaxID=2829810 RepID=UPI001BAD1C2A|nr:zinc-dependent metalloprotease [Nocardioides palaemonis]MBS2939724.1 zinc-dependent metalloprotease [Nocardioides palaemonis]
MNLVDWDLAVTVGSRLTGPGPQVGAEEAHAVVAELRGAADRSTPLVREFTGLDGGDGTAPVLVVDRPGWVQANADGFARIMAPVARKVVERKGEPSALAEAVGSRVTGTEVGLMLGFLSSKVLGQFDPFSEPHGRLLLVAPNVVQVERELGADPHDFRLWVCLHEETHRVQFTANPWLGGHLLAQMEALADTVEPAAVLEGLRRGAEVVRGGGSIIDLVSTPAQREVLDRVTGVMSLLEGHADVVMDGVGPTVVTSVKDIRRKFDQRRKGVGGLDRVLRRLLGLDVKMAQYRDGAGFVRHVVDKVGMDEFNAVWTGPETLPSKAEIGDPDAWVARVL